MLMRFKNNLFFAVFATALKLCLSDLRRYFVHLYRRAWWRHHGLKLAPSAKIIYQFSNQIEINGNCTVADFAILLAEGSASVLPWPLLVLGKNVYVGDHSNIRASIGRILIGSNVLIANNVTIVSSNHGIEPGKNIIDQPWKGADVQLEDDVWIGAGVVILPGAIVRKGAVIAAGAVVRGEVPSNAVYGGIPAREISRRC